MPGYGDHYCQEIARLFKLWAIYEPGRNVSCGDVLTYKDPDSSSHKSNPIGRFTKTAPIKKLNIKIPPQTEDIVAPMHYCSPGATFRFKEGPKLLEVTFANGQDFFLTAINCSQKRFDPSELDQPTLKRLYEEYDWDTHFMVLGVLHAGRALVLQASGAGAFFHIEGPEAHLLDPGINGSPSADHIMTINNKKLDHLYRIWREDHPLFLTLGQIRKTDEGHQMGIIIPT
ncbi:MAG: hypothetical protein DHS20C18_26720 [Saprospiraceae bacterium]|nr:MAG: hypothetical protein DHS20C18_26720 [Saprospiraceae bacterium]